MGGIRPADFLMPFWGRDDFGGKIFLKYFRHPFVILIQLEYWVGRLLSEYY